MWRTNTISESNGRVIKFIINEGNVRLRYSGVLALWRESKEFRTFFTQQLTSVPFDSFRWETPPVTRSSIDREFECAVLDSPGLASHADANAFSEYFKSHAAEDVAVFPNLGGDAILVVPCPLAAPSEYGHLAEFLRTAPDHQQHSLWKSVGQAMEKRLSSAPVWLSTAGAGVSWLHVRLDSRPKYYGYVPYKAPPK